MHELVEDQNQQKTCSQISLFGLLTSANSADWCVAHTRSRGIMKMGATCETGIIGMIGETVAAVGAGNMCLDSFASDAAKKSWSIHNYLIILIILFIHANYSIVNHLEKSS